MINKKDIDSISYDYQSEQMIINLKNRVLIKGYMTNEVAYNCDEKTFKRSVVKWLS